VSFFPTGKRSVSPRGHWCQYFPDYLQCAFFIFNVQNLIRICFVLNCFGFSMFEYEQLLESIGLCLFKSETFLFLSPFSVSPVISPSRRDGIESHKRRASCDSPWSSVQFSQWISCCSVGWILLSCPFKDSLLRLSIWLLSSSSMGLLISVIALHFSVLKWNLDLCVFYSWEAFYCISLFQACLQLLIEILF
jgi:hypothetical protein